MRDIAIFFLVCMSIKPSLLISFLFLAGCAAQTPPAELEDAYEDTTMEQEVDEDAVIQGNTNEEEDVEVMEEVRTVEIQASNWAFTPAMIAAKQGEKVRLKIVGESGVHGFAIPALGVNVQVNPGQTVMMDLPTDQAGAFDAKCSIPCGSGHRDMKATIVIE